MITIENSTEVGPIIFAGRNEGSKVSVHRRYRLITRTLSDAKIPEPLFSSEHRLFQATDFFDCSVRQTEIELIKNVRIANFDTTSMPNVHERIARHRTFFPGHICLHAEEQH